MGKARREAQQQQANLARREQQLLAKQERILDEEEERARRERIDAIRSRVTMRNSFLSRAFGMRGGDASAAPAGGGGGGSSVSARLAGLSDQFTSMAGSLGGWRAVPLMGLAALTRFASTRTSR